MVDIVYPLARELDPNLTLDGWRRIADDRLSGGHEIFADTGILAASRNGWVRALASFEVRHAPGSGQTLFVSDVAVLDRVRETRLALELLGGLLTRAARANCVRVRATLPSKTAWLRRNWEDPRGELFRMPVECIVRSDVGEAHTRASHATVVPFPSRYNHAVANSNI